MAEPPVSAGALQEISILDPSANVLTGASGASGATAARKLTGSEGSLSPISFYAMTRYA